jgi:hypothetical protein
MVSNIAHNLTAYALAPPTSLPTHTTRNDVTEECAVGRAMGRQPLGKPMPERRD